jgi:predicted nucleic acid-binding Zn ribbon protein
MKTTYEKLAKNGIDIWLFGKEKKKRFGLLWVLILAIIVMGIVI